MLTERSTANSSDQRRRLTIGFRHGCAGSAGLAKCRGHSAGRVSGCREDASTARRERCVDGSAGLQVEALDVSVQQECRDGRVGGQTDPGEWSCEKDPVDVRGEAGGRLGSRCGRAEKYVFWPVDDMHGAVHVRGCGAGEKELAGPYCSVCRGAVPEF